MHPSFYSDSAGLPWADCLARAWVDPRELCAVTCELSKHLEVLLTSSFLQTHKIIDEVIFFLLPLWWIRELPDFQVVFDGANKTRARQFSFLKSDTHCSPGDSLESLPVTAPPKGLSWVLAESSPPGMSESKRSCSRVPEGCSTPHTEAGVRRCHQRVTQKVLSHHQSFIFAVKTFSQSLIV